MGLLRPANQGLLRSVKYDLPGEHVKSLIALLYAATRTKFKNKNKNKHKKRENYKMRNQTYTTRRSQNTVNFSRNRNTVRHMPKGLGSISQIVIICLLTLAFGLIYVAESTKATGYDYAISEVESNIAEMTAKKEDLAVEKARLTSVATAKNSTVAAAMEDASVTGYAAN